MFSVFEWKRREVLGVGGVLGVILAISVVQLRVGEMKTRDLQRKSDADLVVRAIHKYYSDLKLIPEGNAQGEIVMCGGLHDLGCKWGEGELKDEEGVVYMKKLPQDAGASEGRRYVYRKEGSKFRVYVGLEYGRDPGRRAGLTVECGNGVQCNWYAEGP